MDWIFPGFCRDVWGAGAEARSSPPRRPPLVICHFPIGADVPEALARQLQVHTVEMRLADLPASLFSGFHQLSGDGEQVFGNDSVGDARDCVHRQEIAVIGLAETSGDMPPIAGLEPDVHYRNGVVRGDAGERRSGSLRAIPAPCELSVMNGSRLVRTPAAVPDRNITIAVGLYGALNATPRAPFVGL